MLSEYELTQIGTNELIKIFGKKYLRDNFEGTCSAFGFISENIYQFFVGIKGKKDLPNKKANAKGWVVYGLIYIDANTGEIMKAEYATE